MQVVVSSVLAATVLFTFCSLVWSARIRPRKYKYGGKEFECSDEVSNGIVCKIEKDCTDSELCLDTVLIAENEGSKLHVKSIGAAIGKRYILTTVSSEFPKFFEHGTPLYAIKGKEIYVLRNASTIPRMIPGDFDAHAWNDVLLIELPNGQAFEGDDFVPISRSMPTATGEYGVAEDGNGGFVIGNARNPIKFNNSLILRKIEECQEAFEGFPVLVDDDHFSCHRDEHYIENTKVEAVLIGSPLYATKNGTDTRYLTGMRSFTIDDGSFLVTKLSIHCDWIEETTYGEVICID